MEFLGIGVLESMGVLAMGVLLRIAAGVVAGLESESNTNVPAFLLRWVQSWSTRYERRVSGEMFWRISRSLPVESPSMLLE